MSVIINDFEVVGEEPQAAEEAGTEAPAPVGTSTEISPLKVEDILRWQSERMQRLRAH